MDSKILLVDDEEGIRTVLGISLADSGYHVLTAANGERALEIFKDEQPGIVLTDIKMPGMDGIELLQKIKDVAPDTEVIMITGHGDMQLAIQSLKSDATDFITKPIDDDALEIALMRAKDKIALKAQIKTYTENLETLVAEKTQQLLEAERLAAVGETVAGLAHAIKNLTGGITGGMFVLEKGIELDNRKYLCQGWDMVKTDVARITSVALDLLNYAKPREPEYRLCDPNQPLTEVHNLMLPRAQTYGVALELQTDTSLPEMYFDPDGIHRCLLNLVSNAIDACADIECSRKSKTMLKVILAAAGAPDGTLEYRIADTGCGMDAATRDQIFQRFFTTKGSQGTGLGLMITKKIIDEHGGQIRFESQRGKGTTFTIKLPVRQPTTETTTPPA